MGWFSSEAQDTSYLNKTTLFSEGVYFDNMNLLIPWEITNEDTYRNYGNPQVKEGGMHFEVKWDSVKFLNQFLVSFSAKIPRKNFEGKGTRNISYFRAFIDSTTAANLISFFEQITGLKSYLSYKKMVSSRWTINDCKVIVGSHRGRYAIDLINMKKNRM